MAEVRAKMFSSCTGGRRLVLAISYPVHQWSLCLLLSSSSNSSSYELLPCFATCPPSPCFSFGLLFSSRARYGSSSPCPVMPPLFVPFVRYLRVTRTNPKAAAVLLVSDEPNDSDVLLVSFELEQMLSEIPPGQRAPKVARDHSLCMQSSAISALRYLLVSRNVGEGLICCSYREGWLRTCPEGSVL